MSGLQKAFSLTDLETELETVNKSTIFRTLSLFHENLLIHSIDDGSGSISILFAVTPVCVRLASYTSISIVTAVRIRIVLKVFQYQQFSSQKNFFWTVNFVMKGICKDCSRFVKTK
jgi:Fur family ferric uptake transcriptional regulator